VLGLLLLQLSAWQARLAYQVFAVEHGTKVLVVRFCLLVDQAHGLVDLTLLEAPLRKLELMLGATIWLLLYLHYRS